MTATLLAVDDSKTMRKVIEITFAGENYRTVLANNPAEAMAKLRAEKPVVAIVDALLGTASGYELCQQIKAESPQVGVIVLGSKQHPYDRAKGSAVGADDFLDKPYDTQALIDKTAALVQKMASAPAARPAATPAATTTTAAVRPAPVAVTAQPNVSPMATSGLARQPTQTMAFGSRLSPATSPQGTPAQAAPAQAQPPAAQAAPAQARTTTASFGAVSPSGAQAPAAQPAAGQSAAAQPPVATPLARIGSTTMQPAVAPPPPAGTPVAPPVQPVAAVSAAAPVVAPAQPVAAMIDASMETKLTALGLTKDQIVGVMALSREVVEQVVWEVVPVLAETMIREEIKRLTAE